MTIYINYSIAVLHRRFDFPVFAMIAAILIVCFGFHGALASYDVTGYDNCLCNKLFDLLVDVKAKWNVNMQKVEQLEKKVAQLENQNSSGENQQGGSCKLPVAFYAIRDVNTVVSGGNIVDFKKVITDTCNTYNSTTSTFTCPSDGVYVFNYFALDSATDHLNHLLLRKNNKTVAYTWSRGKSGNLETGANTAILNLVKGDKVHIIAHSRYPSQPHSGYSTFSGFKLN